MTEDPSRIFIEDASALAVLQGAELTGVFVWKYGVTLSFDNRPDGNADGTSLSITVENNAEFRAQGRAEIYNQEVIVAFGARMLALVGFAVRDVNVTDGKTLTLAFEEGSALRLRPDSTGYESYTVNLPDGSIFVG
jgi:hypothetical protein